jgi:hypothetical protein
VSRFSDQEAVLSLECTLFIDVFLETLKSGSPEGIVEFGPLYVDATHAFNRGAIAEKEIGKLENGRLPRVTADIWEAERTSLTRQIAVFMLNAMASQQADRISQFLLLNEASERPLLDIFETKCLEEANSMASSASQSTFGAVGALRESLAHGTRPVVPTLFMTSLRLLDAIRMADGFATCVEFVVNWTVPRQHQWHRFDVVI